MFFGLKWEAFLAFCASAISKESLLGVLNIQSWIYAGLIWSGAFGCLIAALNFRNADKDEPDKNKIKPDSNGIFHSKVTVGTQSDNSI